jgi:hypothetical protein
VYEDALRLVFTLVASNRARKQAALRLVVAKNHEECSAQILAEYEVLTDLAPSARLSVLSSPVDTGCSIFLIGITVAR